jgi:hypothetical protein
LAASCGNDLVLEIEAGETPGSAAILAASCGNDLVLEIEAGEPPALPGVQVARLGVQVALVHRVLIYSELTGLRPSLRFPLESRVVVCFSAFSGFDRMLLS